MIIKDISIIEWQPLPAPVERYVLIRWFEDGQILSDVAFTYNGTTFVGAHDQPLGMKVGAWALLPYDMP